MARVAELVVYPVKGCAGTRVGSAEAGPRGLAHDREFMVVSGAGSRRGADGEFRSQRRDPAMARIAPRITGGGAALELAAPGAGSIAVPTAQDGPLRPVVLHGAPYTGADQGDAAAEWLSDVLGAPSRLVRVPRGHDRITGGATPGSAGFADSTALLMASLSSLDLLNARIGESGGAALPMDRFRPNIVVDGWPEPHTEDRVRTAAAGTAELGYAKLCIRCAVTTVDQERGVKDGPEPLRALAGYRRAAEGGVAFGAKFAVTAPGRIAVGDPLDVTSWGAVEPALAAALSGE